MDSIVDDNLLIIFEFVNLYDLLSLKQMNRRFRRLISANYENTTNYNLYFLHNNDSTYLVSKNSFTKTQIEIKCMYATEYDNVLHLSKLIRKFNENRITAKYDMINDDYDEDIDDEIYKEHYQVTNENIILETSDSLLECRIYKNHLIILKLLHQLLSFGKKFEKDDLTVI